MTNTITINTSNTTIGTNNDATNNNANDVTIYNGTTNNVTIHNTNNTISNDTINYTILNNKREKDMKEKKLIDTKPITLAKDCVKNIENLIQDACQKEKINPTCNPDLDIKNLIKKRKEKLSTLILAIQLFLYDQKNISSKNDGSFIMVSRNSMVNAFTKLDEEEAYTETMKLLKSSFNNYKISWSIKDDNYLYINCKQIISSTFK